MNAEVICPHCRQPIPANAIDGACPVCSPRLSPDLTRTRAGDSACPVERITGVWTAPGGIGDDAPTLPPARDANPSLAVQESAGVPGYEIFSVLGRGGMGVVYKARHLALNRLVALKMILSGGHAGADDRGRFLAEAEAIAKVKHPGIVQVYDFGTHDGLPFFSLELCESGSLADRLRDGPLKAPEAAGLVEKIARAVQAAHEAGIVHRDLKPGNVLLVEDGSPRVTDFGLAKRTEGGGHTQTGAVMGTPSYMAPEQAEGKKDVGPAADVWALGAILFECLSGRPPFRAATPLDTILQVVADEPVSLRQLNRLVPVDLETICHKCLQKDVAKRYASAAEMADDLRRFAEGRPIAARPVGRLERLVRWCRREPQVAGLLAAVLLVLTAGVIVSSVLGMKAAHSASLAQRKAEEADEQRERASEKAREATENEQRASREKDRANEQRDRAELLVYAGKLAQAQLMWKDDKGAEALGLLDECQWNLRGWEHRHLWSLYHSNQVTFRGHTDAVSSVTWSPDGKRILSGGFDNTLKVWDAEKGQEVLSLKGHTNAVQSVAWSPDGKRILSGSRDNTLKVWDAEKGQEVLSLKGHIGPVTSVAWSPDGKRILSGGGGENNKPGEMKVWDAEKGQELLSLKGHAGWVMSVAWSPDGKHIVSGSWDKTLKVWDAQKGQEVLSLKGHTARVLSVAWSPDGKRILSGGGEYSKPGELKVWDAQKGQEVLSLKGHTGPVSSVAWSPDGKRFLSGSYDSTLKVWDAEKGQEVLSLKGHTVGVSSVAWSPDGKRILSGGGEYSKPGELKVWDAQKGQEVLSLKGHTVGVSSVAWSPDGKRILSGSEDGTLKVWDAQKGQEVLSLKAHTTAVSSVAWSPDGKRFLSGSSWDSTLKVWDAQKGQEVLSLKGHIGKVFSVAWSPDGKRILSGGGENNKPGEMKVWDAQKGQEVLSLKGHTDRVLSVAWSPDGKRILSGSGDKTLKVWDAQKGQELLSLEGYTNGVSSVAWSPDGKRILSSGTYANTPKVWDAEKGQELLSLKGHTGMVSDVAWSPDGKRILSGSGDNTLKVWDAEKGQELLSLKGHTDGVRCVAWSPDGNSILSGSQDSTLKVWDAEKRQEVLSFNDDTGPVSSVAFSLDGKRVSGKDETGKVLTWDATTGQLLPDADPMPVRQQTEATSRDGSLRAFIENGQIKVALVEVQKRQQEQDRLFLERLAQPDPTYHFQKTDLYEKSGDHFAAAFHLRRLLRIEPKDEAVRKRLAAVEARLAALAKAEVPPPQPAKMSYAK